jgi:hypothetical protein
MVIILNIIGIFIATLIAVNISEYFLKVYIGLLVLIVGLLVLFMIDVRIHFSWLKIVILGILASFNKGMSGGGYGPVITGGQIISGVETKGAIGITTLSEGITCFAGLLIYILLGKSIMWSLALPLILGSLLSAPLGALFVSRFREKDLMKAIGILCLVLGMFVALKIFATG